MVKLITGLFPFFVRQPNQMNILLLQPKFLSSEATFPLGLAYLASSLTEANQKVFGLDCAFCNFSAVRKTILENNIELIAISCHSYNYPEVMRLCRMLKSNFSIPIACGGAHCTLFPESVAGNKDIDFVIAGEGEKAIVGLAEAIEQNKGFGDIPSLFYRDTQGKLFKNGRCAPIKDLSSLPFPDWDAFPLKSYFGMNSRNRHYAPIITSRGCTHACRFCPANKLWAAWRFRRAADVADEIESVMRENKIREFHIEDDNFFVDPERVVAICNELIRRSLNISWQCANGLNPEDVPPSAIEPMARSGCYRIALGIESFNDGLLERMGRKSDIGRVRDIIAAAHRHSVEVTGYFMLGLPGETLDSIKSTVRLSRKLGLDFMAYSAFHVVPGSAVYEGLKSEYPLERIINKKVSLCSIDIGGLNKIKRNAYISSLFNKKVCRYIFRSLNSTKNLKNFFFKLRENALS